MSGRHGHGKIFTFFSTAETLALQKLYIAETSELYEDDVSLGGGIHMCQKFVLARVQKV